MKGQINIVELIFVVLALLIAFAILFPGFSYQSRWPAAFLVLGSKDLLLTMDRIGKIYDYSFDSIAFSNFVNSIAPVTKTNWIAWSETEGTIKSQVIVACNCTVAQADFLELHTGNMFLNGRNVSLDFITSNLDKINEPSDVLLIWGDKDLTLYRQQLIDYLNEGNGIIEVADFLNPDNTEKEIFGIDRCSELGVPACGWSDEVYDVFTAPEGINSSLYLPYKYFYHIPYPAKAYQKSDSIPIEGGIADCSSKEVWGGNFTFNNLDYKFWICNTSTVYFDTNRNEIADSAISVRNSFSIQGYSFFLSYVKDFSISISFRPSYQFTDFVIGGNTKIYVTDGNIYRILLSKGNYSSSKYPIPVVVISPNYNAIWMANFGRAGISSIGHDHMNLLTSLIFSVSNKKSISPLYKIIKLGYLVSYVNIKDSFTNFDMYEVYKLNLGLAYPY